MSATNSRGWPSSGTPVHIIIVDRDALALHWRGIRYVGIVLLFLLEDVFKLALVLPVGPVRGRGWLLASGVLPLLFGILIILGLPGAAVWVLGLMVGVNLLLTGAVLVSIAVAIRPDVSRWAMRPRTCLHSGAMLS